MACLNSPILGMIPWGPDLLTPRNDARIPSVADRHRADLGRSVAKVCGGLPHRIDRVSMASVTE